jgi:hypothetical protein
MLPTDPRERKKAYIDGKRKDLQAESDHLDRIRKVFSGDDGLAVLEWILSDLCQFWSLGLDASNIGQFNLGRSIFDTVTLADINIAHALLDRRRAIADRVRREDEKRLEREAREIV